MGQEDLTPTLLYFTGEKGAQPGLLPDVRGPAGPFIGGALKHSTEIS